MKILVRLPNWLGDMVMSVGFIDQLHQFYPEAEISVIAKKGIHELLPFFPHIKGSFIFDKKDHKGIKGLWKFGKKIGKQDKFDLFFCLPDSFSSAIMGYATGAKKRIGYKKELRTILLTHAYNKENSLHRVEEYVGLLRKFAGKPVGAIHVSLQHQFQRKDHVVVNINSEASSRRLTTGKAIELLNTIRSSIDNKIVLIGAPKEKEFVESVLHQLHDKSNVESVAGKTNLPQLIEVLATAKAMLTTDSGPAHLSNALGTPTIVLFGAGNENNTAPYSKELRKIIRLGELSCEPCTKNVCVRYGVPQCLERLNSIKIAEELKGAVNEQRFF
jgi:heptosyltransferase II